MEKTKVETNMVQELVERGWAKIRLQEEKRLQEELRSALELQEAILKDWKEAAEFARQHVPAEIFQYLAPWEDFSTRIVSTIALVFDISGLAPVEMHLQRNMVNDRSITVFGAWEADRYNGTYSVPSLGWNDPELTSFYYREPYYQYGSKWAAHRGNDLDIALAEAQQVGKEYAHEKARYDAALEKYLEQQKELETTVRMTYEPIQGEATETPATLMDELVKLIRDVVKEEVQQVEG